MATRLTLVISLLFICISVRGATDDSLQKKIRLPTLVRSISESSFAKGIADYQYPDTNLLNKEETNPAIQYNYNYLGTLGSAAHPRVYKTEHGLYSRPGISSYDLYLWRPDSIRYFRTNKRYTKIDYHQGNFKEQQIRVFHTQNITKNWNAGLDFKRMTVRDFTRNSRVYHSLFALFTWYESNNKRYNLFSNAISNAIYNNVNGGLVSDSLFENTVVSNLALKGLAIHLTDAIQRLHHHTFYLSQYYDLGETKRAGSDSSSNKSVNTFLRLNHSISYESNSLAYRDHVSDSTFYHNFFISPTSTTDSLHYYDLRNRFAISLPLKDSIGSLVRRNLAIVAGFEHQWFKYTQLSDTSWQNYSLIFSAATRPGKDRFVASLNGSYVVHGHDASNYEAEVRVSSPDYPEGKITLTANAGRRSPDIIFQYNGSNHFQWRNDFNKIQVYQFSSGYQLDKYHFNARINVQQLKKLVVVDENAFPEQVNDNINVLQIFLKKNFIFHSIHFDNSVVFQKSGNDSLMPLPSWVTSHALYYERPYFNKALLLQWGLKLHYSASYFAESFMPATGLFYLQYNKKTGGYPLFDLYVSGKIKTATIFLNVENIADGFPSDQYTLTPHYPQPGRVVKFGLIWRFFD